MGCMCVCVSACKKQYHANQLPFTSTVTCHVIVFLSLPPSLSLSLVLRIHEFCLHFSPTFSSSSFPSLMTVSLSLSPSICIIQTLNKPTHWPIFRLTRYHVHTVVLVVFFADDVSMVAHFHHVSHWSRSIFFHCFHHHVLMRVYVYAFGWRHIWQ